MTGPVIQESVAINASPSIWPLLGPDSRAPSAGFGCAIVSDWVIGSKVVEKHIPTGIVVAEGLLLKSVPNEVLQLTIAAAGDTSAEPGIITFMLSAVDRRRTILTLNVTHDVFMRAAAKSQLDAARARWMIVLEKIWELAEQEEARAT